MTNLTKYKMETVVNYNAGEQTATVYTGDKSVMRKLDRLVADYPDSYKLLNQTDIDKTYSMPNNEYKQKSRFDTLSIGAKMLYGMMIDRMELSQKNGWIDKQGMSYIYFTVDEVKDRIDLIDSV